MADATLPDAIGQRGEAIFYVLITRAYGRDNVIFRPQFLGDKWPAVDYIVELREHPPNLTLAELPFPLCLFVFAMDSDLGYYRWLLEPVVNPGQSPVLVMNTVPHFTQLTKAALDRLLRSFPAESPRVLTVG